MKTILVVDDEPAILTLLRYNLEQEHFKVRTATDGAQAVTMVLQQPFDFIILDLMLPKLDGIAVTKKIREAKLKTPIMILTAKDSETDKIVGLEVGADDYVTKPFSPREIIARIRAIERRTVHPVGESETHLDEIVQVGELSVDEGEVVAKKGTRKLHLTPKEFELLVYFMHRINKVQSREKLLNAVWGFDYPAETRMVDIQVSHLREKIETDPRHPSYLKTVRGFGYQLEDPTHDQA
ncbi:response regulator transcription factor [Latilactobacillus graminis]|uniref:Alkaline phosphatase synthesis transcriptional regulatory protein phoP n=2 Tax=Latilactobacillus graminis TaxID=60519 RepID=A0AA89I0W7_9LACO|nr:response regulator transcription factor [Latilactobacillus graminis]KRM20673.1 alkaline phosphatase synthesis transcriptional regulatory protein phoP [Latilactobacillus graminis DSM 20719]QFP79959.1 response regulator transcription factor [Latilactobacillus graminis]